MRFSNLFLQASSDPYASIHFTETEAIGDGVPFEIPDGWSYEAAEILAEDVAAELPTGALRPLEENTVPSWLWQYSLRAEADRENSARLIFDRVAGAATYRGWQHKLFDDESSARAFFDEARYALAQRFIAIEPRQLRRFGLAWAYGIEAPVTAASSHDAGIDVSNAMIDTIVSGKRDRAILNKWHKIVSARTKEAALSLRFTDTVEQWEKPLPSPVGVRLNLMAFRHNDGAVNIEALRQAVRIGVLLVDLQDEAAGHAPMIGFANLAPLLMALALPYDSDAGRATAAAISAIITAEAYAVSAELAELRGVSVDFAAHREDCLRALRNHRRAAYGEHNDYEKISVIPAPLALASCPDLHLTAAARGAWDRALELAQAHGLWHTQLTGLIASPMLTLFMGCDADGILPLRSVAVIGSDSDQRMLHSSVSEGLARLGYDSQRIERIGRYAVGAMTLADAPGVHHAALAKRGFTSQVLAAIEECLPQARSLRAVFTPWVLGVHFCRKVLKIPAAKIEDLRFDMLAFLGFSDAAIRAAQSWCYGHDAIDSALFLEAQHAHVFATAATLPSEAAVRMAAAIQGFVSGGTDLRLRLPVGMQAELFEKLLLDVWRRGVKYVDIHFDALLKPVPVKNAQDAVRRKALRKIAAAVYLHAKAPRLPKSRVRSVSSRLGAPPSAKAKSRGLSKGH